MYLPYYIQYNAIIITIIMKIFIMIIIVLFFGFFYLILLFSWLYLFIPETNANNLDFNTVIFALASQQN